MYTRVFLAVTLVLALLPRDLAAQKKKKSTSDDEGYIPQVLPDTKRKKQKEEETQTLPPARELPTAVVAETDRLAFDISPLTAKGLLSQQTREALKSLLKTNRGTIVKLRAFVAGSGDLRRVGELAAEMFAEKHQPPPVVSIVQVGGLPLINAQVVIEATVVDKRAVNPNGIAFVSGQSAPSLAKSLDLLKTALRGANLEPNDALRVTCFVSSLDDEKSAHAMITSGFPGAVVNYVQMRRTPAAECEAVARLKTAPPASFVFANPPGLDKSPYYSHVALVNSPRLVITATQLAFGTQESDLKLAFERLGKALNSSNSRFGDVVMSHVYLSGSGMTDRIRTVRSQYYTGKNPPASTMLPFEGLPGLDAQMGLDVISIADSTNAQR